ncbi:MAG TPA: zinc ribbon domain-containing protein [Verrucomicrobiae bacterium]|nr:zinc ribbon domain-containing protein [Verrucomicrobiae bacterium]
MRDWLSGPFIQQSTDQQSAISSPAYNLPRRISCGRRFMPVYDYVCLDCHQPFERVLTLSEHDQEMPKCPHCGSKNVEQEAAAFFAVTSRKS